MCTLGGIQKVTVFTEDGLYDVEKENCKAIKESSISTIRKEGTNEWISGIKYCRGM